MSSGRILIVDDSDNVRNVLQMNFEWLGYQVICARDGEEALRLVNESPPDLIILDVMMPRRNGYQVCRTLKTDPRHKGIPVIFLTAKDQKEDRFWGKDCGADEYVTKPFSAAKLEQVISRLLGERRGAAAEGDITARFKALRASGMPCSLATFRLEPKALGVFRQKYGEIKYREAVERLRTAIDSVLEDESKDALVDRYGEGAFRAVLPCDPETTSVLASRICAQGEIVLKALYGREDAERGYVLVRGPSTGEELHMPLMSVEKIVDKEGLEP